MKNRRRSLVCLLPAMVALAPLGGCLVYNVVSAPVKVAGAAVGVAGQVAGAVVTTTGKVAVGAVKATGSLVGGGVETTARLAQAGMVTMADVATGTVVRVPWQSGLTLAGAGDAAKLRLAQRAVEIVRDGKIIYSAVNGAAKNPPVAAGDVVQVGK